MGFARITQIDAAPNPKVAQFLKDCHNRGRRFVGTGKIRSCVQRTSKYNKRLGMVKNNLQRNSPPGGKLSGTCFNPYFSYFSAFSRADKRDL